MERALMTQHQSPDCYTFNVEVMSSKSAADFSRTCTYAPSEVRRLHAPLTRPFEWT
jgi:hypothetical protein